MAWINSVNSRWPLAPPDCIAGLAWCHGASVCRRVTSRMTGRARSFRHRPVIGAVLAHARTGQKEQQVVGHLYLVAGVKLNPTGDGLAVEEGAVLGSDVVQLAVVVGVDQ